MDDFIENILTIELLIILTFINNIFASKYSYKIIYILSLIYGLYIDIVYIIPIIGLSIIIYNSTKLYHRINVHIAGYFTILCS